MLLAMQQSLSDVRTNAVPLLKQTWQEFSNHNGQWLAAALAYFTAFAIAPLIIVIVEIIGLVLGSHQHTLNLIYGYLGHSGSAAGAVKAIVSATFNEPRNGIIAQIIGWVVFAIAAIGLFSALQFALNTIWEVQPKNLGWKDQIRQRAVAFGVLLALVALMMLSMGINAVLTIAAGFLTHVFPGFATILKIVDFIVSFGVLTVAFALVFEFLPDTRIEWRDVWAGAALTSLLFVVGQFLLGWYLGRAGLTSGYGAFGSLIVLLIWVNYSAQIILLGAQFTCVFARRFGSQCKEDAQPTATRGEVAFPSRAGERSV